MESKQNAKLRYWVAVHELCGAESLAVSEGAAWAMLAESKKVLSQPYAYPTVKEYFEARVAAIDILKSWGWQVREVELRFVG